MSSCPREAGGAGRRAASNQYQQMRTNQAPCEMLKPGGRTAIVSYQNEFPHYSSATASAQSDNRLVRCILAECVPNASLGRRRLPMTALCLFRGRSGEGAPNATPTVNAFLTLPDVTKW